MSKKANFKNSFGLLFVAVAVFLGFRWAVLEPFVIPSGSMIPSLLINDHIVVAKWSYGLRIPFTEIWLTPQRLPERGDVVVFSSTERDNFFMIKRVVGLPGDVIASDDEGRLIVNGEPVPMEPIEESDLGVKPFYRIRESDLGRGFSSVELYLETLDKKVHPVVLNKGTVRWQDKAITVPEGKLYLLGDNRDSSRDSRYWGFVPQKNLVGKALFVWLSCHETLVQMNYICDPRHIRWQRLFYPIQ